MTAASTSETTASTSETAESAAIDDVREGLPSGVSGEAATQRLQDPRPVLAWIMAAIATWGLVLAGGVVWYDYDAGTLNFWKPLTIVICVAGFLGLFRWTMSRSQRRSR
jgi:hypothetical protein